MMFKIHDLNVEYVYLELAIRMFSIIDGHMLINY